jgi:hypothetical protein
MTRHVLAAILLTSTLDAVCELFIDSFPHISIWNITNFMWDLSVIFECNLGKNLETAAPNSVDILQYTMPDPNQQSKNGIYKYFHNARS